MSEQIKDTTFVVNPELLSINIGELNNQYLLPEVDHINESYSYPMISLPFPPVIKPIDLIVNKRSPQDSPNGKQVRAPNAFIIYRKAFVKAARDQGYILPMTVISSMASAYWDQESPIVKEEYKRIAKDAHKLVKEMFPKKLNQRKRKEKWNIVSFHNNKDNEDNDNNITMTNLSSPEIVSPQEPTAITSSLSSPNLSEFDSDIIEDTDENQTSNNYLIDELSNANIPNSFQEYLNSNFYGDNQIKNWLNQSENYELEESELFGATSSIDDVSQSSLNVTLSEVIGIIESKNFDLGIEL